MQLRDKIAGSDIDKPAGNKRQKKYGEITHPCGKDVSYSSPQNTGKAGNIVIKKCFGFAESAVD